MKPDETRAREWAIAASITLAVLLVTSLPYLVGWVTSTPERIFTGFIIDVEDIYSYLAKMQLGYRGEWQYRILFDPGASLGRLSLHFLCRPRPSGALGAR